MPAAYPYDERDLILRLSEGDTHAFTVLFNQYKDKIYTLAFKMTGCDFLAEEAVQEIFAKIWINRKEMPAIIHFNAWFNTVVRNHLFSMMRSQAARESREAFFAGQATHITNNADQNILLKQAESLLREALSTLPPQQNKVYYLIRMKGLKKEEVAIRLKLSQETVKSHLSKAIKNVRAYCLSRKDSIVVWLIIFSVLK